MNYAIIFGLALLYRVVILKWINVISRLLFASAGRHGKYEMMFD